MAARSTGSTWPAGRIQLIAFTAKVSRGMGPLLDFPRRVDEGPVQWRILQGVAQSPDGKRLAFFRRDTCLCDGCAGWHPASADQGH